VGGKEPVGVRTALIGGFGGRGFEFDGGPSEPEFVVESVVVVLVSEGSGGAAALRDEDDVFVAEV